MPYDETKDLARSMGGYRRMTPITPSNTVDMSSYATIYALTAGTVKFIPAQNADADTITITVPVGWQSPCVVRRVFATGTSATFATLQR